MGKGYTPPPQPAGPTPEEIAAEEARKAAEAEALRIEGEKTDLRNLFQERENQIADVSRTVDSTIKQEQSRANLLGLEYEITEDQRSSRISDALAGVRTSDQDSYLLEKLNTYEDVGKELGFTGEFDLGLGTAPKDFKTKNEGSKKKTIINPEGVDDELETLGGATILG